MDLACSGYPKPGFLSLDHGQPSSLVHRNGCPAACQSLIQPQDSSCLMDACGGRTGMKRARSNFYIWFCYQFLTEDHAWLAKFEIRDEIESSARTEIYFAWCQSTTLAKRCFSPVWCSWPPWSCMRQQHRPWSKSACWRTSFWAWGTNLGRRTDFWSNSGWVDCAPTLTLPNFNFWQVLLLRLQRC